MHRLAAILLAFLSLAGVAPIAGAATTTNAPPGQSAIDEYLETVPGDGGNSGAGGKPDLRQPSVASKAAASLPAKTLRSLQRGGADARAAAALAAASTRDASAGRSDGTAANAALAQTPAAAAGSGSPVGPVVHAVTGTEGGFGAVFPVLLIGILILAVTMGILRRRGRGTPVA